MTASRPPALTVKTAPDGPPKTFGGRLGWALARLIDAGEHGITAIENPAPRWSSYIHKLRRAGLVIETIDERHGGPFAGTHGRYVLETQIEVVDRVGGI